LLKEKMDSTLNSTITVDINRGFKKVQLRQGASLLAGLARNNVFIPSACGGNARCGYCKIRVLSGENGPTAPELPLLSEKEKAEGFRLACQTKPDKDIAIEIPEELFSVKRFSGKVVQKKNAHLRHSWIDDRPFESTNNRLQGRTIYPIKINAL
jgi:Na+-transporting NADH:ubiquinone oxidoreductase subunit F